MAYIYESVFTGVGAEGGAPSTVSRQAFEQKQIYAFKHTLTYFGMWMAYQCFESVDGSGNFKITKFFEVKTGKCSKFIFLTLFSPCERPKSIPFFI